MVRIEEKNSSGKIIRTYLKGKMLGKVHLNLKIGRIRQML